MCHGLIILSFCIDCVSLSFCGTTFISSFMSVSLLLMHGCQLGGDTERNDFLIFKFIGSNNKAIF
jgi:hypothetical protein